MPEHHIRLRRSPLFRSAVLHSIRRADLVCVPSQHVRGDLLARVAVAPERVRVVPAGVGDEFRPSSSGAIQAAVARLGLPARYILHVGTIEPRKNLGVLLESYRRLVDAHAVEEHLVLAGPRGWGYEGLLAQCANPALRDRVHLIGYVPQEDLPLVYAGARLCVYPSLEEGFGLPPLEAMASGVPVVSSRSSSLVENLAGAAELVAPEDVTALAAAMHRLLHDEALRVARVGAGLVRAGAFRWTETARATRACYEEVSPSRAAVQRSR
jgi:alpha-1,3-rhamnosyl/mannosyltransferase